MEFNAYSIGLGLGFAMGFCLALLMVMTVWKRERPRKRQREKLMFKVTAAANAILTVNLARYSEGVKVSDVLPEETLLEIVGSQGEPGEVIPGTNQINPGAVGAVFMLHASDLANPGLGRVEVEVTLEVGAPDHLDADLFQNNVQLPETPAQEPLIPGGSGEQAQGGQPEGD